MDIFNKATIPISKVNSIEEVVEDPFVKPNLIRSKDPKTGSGNHYCPSAH